MPKRFHCLNLIIAILICFTLSGYKNAPQLRHTEVSPIRVALALGGGGYKGFAHIGVIKVLTQNQIPIDIITGTSAGAILGCLYASGIDIDDLEAETEKFSLTELIDFSITNKNSLVNHRIRQLINQSIDFKLIESFPIQFAAVATELNTQEAVLLDKGDAGLAVQASSSIPILFGHTVIDNIKYIDGGVAAPVPVKAAKSLGADIVIAVDISTDSKTINTTHLLISLDQALGIANQTALNNELSNADIIIRPKLDNIGTLSGAFRAQAAIDAGEKATKAAIVKIKKIIIQKQQDKLSIPYKAQP